MASFVFPATSRKTFRPILWEGEGNPDAWKDFVEMAKHVGAPFVTFSEMTLEREELDAPH